MGGWGGISRRNPAAGGHCGEAPCIIMMDSLMEQWPKSSSDSGPTVCAPVGCGLPRAAGGEVRAKSGGRWLVSRGSQQITCLVLCVLIASGDARLLGEDPETTLKVDVKLVNVFVTVTDSRGAPVANLQKENFVLKEDGKEQKIAIFDKESALPLSIVLAVDTSLSTRKDLPLELSSAKKFAHTILRAQDGLAVYKFSETVSQMVGFTNELKKIDEGIEHPRNGAATALYDAIY